MTFSDRIARTLSDNKLDDALEMAKAQLKAHPGERDVRNIYIDLLVLYGDYERADAQCDLAANFAPEDAVGFSLLRNQLRGMAARSDWYRAGAVPEFPLGPSDCDKAALQLNIAHRDKAAPPETMAALEALEESRGERPMVCNGTPAGDFRDLDDRTPHALEVITTSGAYLWVDFAKIAEVTLEPIARPRDLAYRQADLRLTDGAAGAVLLPAIYHGTRDDEKFALGRETDWVTEPGGITTGRGQRCFLAGDELVPFHEIRTLLADAGAMRKLAVHG